MKRALLLGGLLAGLLLSAVTAAATPFFTVRLEPAKGEAVSLQLEPALSPAARRRGLMDRQSLPAGHGMIFDFGHDQPVVMWMKNTPLPLDMIFINAQGEVVDLISRTTPLSETYLPARRPARYVIEINAGEAEAAGLGPGARLRLPANFPAFSP